MNIEQLKQTPTLLEITIDDSSIIENYGDAISFWMYDYIDLNTYYDFYRSQSDSDGTALMKALRKIILNKDGNQVLSESDVLPPDVILNVLLKVNEQLGKSKTKLSIQKTGTQPD